MGVQALPTGVYGPLPPGTMGLILGRSSTLLKGIQIHPGIVDADYQEEIKVMTSVQQGVVVIPQGERTAQLVLVPDKVTNNKRARGNQGFGSPGTAAFWVAQLNEQPQLRITIEGKGFDGILDSGADVSVLSLKYWPKAWPLEEGTVQLQGIGQTTPQKSSKIFKWHDEERHEGFVQTYVLPGLPVNLW